jgi:predicted CopG family antitoxin
MATITIEIPDEIYEEMKKENIDWEQFIKKTIINQLKKLKKLNELLKNSEVSDEDVLNIGRKIKREIAKRHGL